MSDEELEQIAGGTVGETVIESEFLYELGYGSVTTGVIELWVDWKGETAKVEKGWAKFGVVCHSNENAKNDFYIDGKKVSRDDAFKYAAKPVNRRSMNIINVGFKKLYSQLQVLRVSF